MNSQSLTRHDPHDALCDALTSLLKAAIDDYRAAAPTLVAVRIGAGPSSSELSLGLLFSGGYQVTHVLARRDVRPFCIDRGVHTRGELEERLLDEALPKYERMLAACCQEAAVRDDIVDEESAAYLEVGTPAAREKGMRLLFRYLTQRQRQQLSKHDYFEVIGGKSGHCYRIRRGRVMNIDQLDRRGRRVCSWCFLPRGPIVTGDVMLAQKLALELDETAALKIAGKERRCSRTPLEAGVGDWPVNLPAPPAC